MTYSFPRAIITVDHTWGGLKVIEMTLFWRPEVWIKRLAGCAPTEGSRGGSPGVHSLMAAHLQSLPLLSYGPPQSLLSLLADTPSHWPGPAVIHSGEPQLVTSAAALLSNKVTFWGPSLRHNSTQDMNFLFPFFLLMYYLTVFNFSRLW